MRSWMKLMVPALVSLGASFAYAEDPGRDYPPFVAVQGYQRTDFVEHRFDKAVFVSDDKGTKTTVAGHLIYVEYTLKDPTAGGDLYLISSLQEQLRAIQDAQILNQADTCPGGSIQMGVTEQPVLTVRFQKGNTPVWVAVSCRNAYYSVTVVEEQAFHH